MSCSAQRDAFSAKAERDGVFGMPTFVADGELFCHDRIDWVVRKLDAQLLRR
jgi:2-hydroxychromene-2-carboxylate isomerase